MWSLLCALNALNDNKDFTYLEHFNHLLGVFSFVCVNVFYQICKLSEGLVTKGAYIWFLCIVSQTVASHAS